MAFLSSRFTVHASTSEDELSITSVASRGISGDVVTLAVRCGLEVQSIEFFGSNADVVAALRLFAAAASSGAEAIECPSEEPQ